MDGTVPQLSHAELVALVLQLQSEVAALRAENEWLKNRIAEIEGKNPTQRLKQSYSMKSEEQRRREAEAAKKKPDRKAHGSSGHHQQSDRRGRRTSQDKIDEANSHELVIPEGFELADCHHAVDRPVWRIRQGTAIRIVYEIWRGPGGETASIDGVSARSEFGIEIHVAVAFLVSMVGLSMDKVCAQLKFFWQLELSKSQADALLSQLARQWTNEFESLCQLLAVSAVVHADETSWSQNSVWAFLSEKARVLVFGCRKDGDTLAQMLSKDDFHGVLVSDDAAVYRGFSKSQKCWAHLLRKAIRFTLLEPNNDEYRTFLDGLLAVYRDARRFAADQRLAEAGRKSRVAKLFDDVSDLCVSRCGDDVFETLAPVGSTDHEFHNLQQEIVRLMCDDELFTFVLHPEASATNNEAERSLRGAAMDRRTGRTSKTLRGAQRRTILVSVLESLKLHLPKFTLASVQSEIQNWYDTGESMFHRLLRENGLDPPLDSKLQKLVPLPATA
jgi:transposase